jgi:aminomethyltransferase
MTEDLKRTPLFSAHQALGGKLVPFAGWELPVKYSDVAEEHRTVRQAAGLFDVSHMGEVEVVGKEAEAALEFLTCNAVKKLTDGKAHYSALINPNGGVVDDIIIYRFSKERFLVCVNASNADKDFAWMTKHNRFDAEFINRSAEFGQIALQGPKAEIILKTLAPESPAPYLKYFHFCEDLIAGTPVIVARTGYTGEDGFELFTPWHATQEVWNALLETGAQFGLIPCGLGARDSLRLEACYPLHGHELGDGITAIESDLGWIVKPEKGEFIGCSVLAEQKAHGAPRSLVGFYVNDKGIVREECEVQSLDGVKIGTVTSGTSTPTVGKALGMALIETKYATLGTKFNAVVRGRALQCEVVKKPFYKRAD